MKRNPREFLRKCQFSLLLIFGTLPVTLILTVMTQPQKLGALWPFPVACAVFSILALLFPGRHRIWLGAAYILMLAAAAFLLGGGILWVNALVYAAIVVYGLVFAGWSWEVEVPSGLIISCTLIHVVAQILTLWTQSNQSQVLSAVSGWFAPAFLVFALLSMLSLNRNVLVLASMSRRKPSSFIRRTNAFAIFIFFLVVLAISLIPAVGDAISTLWAWLKELFAPLPPSEQPTETIFLETMGPVTESQPIVDAQGDPTSTWLMAVLRVVSTITLISISLAIAGVFCIGLVLLFRYLRKLLGSLVGAILADEDADAADYTDEIDNLRSKRPRRSARKADNTSSWNRRNLPPRQQIRNRYRRLLKKHPQWQPSRTAREQIPDNLAQLYERARYTDQPITEKDANVFSEGVKGL